MQNYLKHIFKPLFTALAALLLMLILIVGGLSLWLQTDAARQKVFQMGIGMLQEKLQTKVSADSISIEILKGQVRLYGMQVNDRDDSLLVSIKELHAGIVPHDLLDRTVHVSDVELIGADARLWRDSLNNNFQFVIDAFRKKPGNEHRKKEGKKSKWQVIVDVEKLRLENVHAKWDVRHKQRKNLNKPNRGAFDANHVDVVLNMLATVKQSGKNTYNVSINDMSVHDRASGLRVEQLKTSAVIGKEKIDVGGVLIRLAHSEVKMEPFTIDLKRKDIAKPFTLSADVLLQDISQPFAPVLGHFTTPLHLTTQVGGPLKSLNVENILIQSPDKHLTLTAHGTLDGLFGKKEGLNLQFRDIDLAATHDIKEQIVMHFAKKMRLKMIRQMKAVGDIRFLGSLDVLYKKEVIEGKLSTRFGHLTTRFTIDGNTKYMTGYLDTPSMEMGKLMNIPDLGPVKCRIDFDINISKKTPRPATALPNGRLPMGKIRAKVYDAQYSTIVVPLVNLEMESDGSTASGFLWGPGMKKMKSAQVRYIQTDKEQRVWFRFTHDAQQWLLQESTELLSEKLQADVEADSINVQLFKGEARLYGIRVRDRHNNPLFSMDTLRVSLDAQELMHHTVHVTHLGLHGIDAQLSKDSLEANFRFILDSFGKKGAKKRKTGVAKKKGKNSFNLVLDLKELNIERMHVKWDVKDKPRKNQDNPNRGAFDANHIDMLLNMQAGVRKTKHGDYAFDIRKMDIKDLSSGLQIDSITAYAVLGKKELQVDNLYMQLPNSWVRVQPFTFNIAKKNFGSPFGVDAHIVLQDIAEPFAPVLSHFTTPLDVHAQLSGGIGEIRVDDLTVRASEGNLNMTAEGMLGGLTAGKDSLAIKFSKIDMQSDNETLMQLVMNFAKKVRLKMVRQMKNLGQVYFTGNMDIQHKCESFSGLLSTEYGRVETSFTLDGNTHFMTGYLYMPELHLGKFLNIPHLGSVDGEIDFSFNVSSKAPRPATALPNGRLPQGSMKASINNARYGIFHAKKVEAVIDSDGSTATGSIMIPRNLSDLIVNFNYIQTDEQQHVKVRLKHKFHWPWLFQKIKPLNWLRNLFHHK